MYGINGFKLYSFGLGCKYVRTFRVNDRTGLVSDYVLGESGAKNSPIPANFFDHVRSGSNGVEIRSERGTSAISVTQDNTYYREHIEDHNDELESERRIFSRAKHLIGGVHNHIEYPSLKFAGFIWDFIKSSTKPRSRFEHPAASALQRRLLSTDLESTESPSEVGVRLSFRKEVDRSFVLKGMDDFVNIILHFRDVRVSDLWEDVPAPVDSVKKEEDRVAAISVDIQRVFDPRRQFEDDAIERHFKHAGHLLTHRVSDILEGFSFEPIRQEEPQGQK